MITPPLPSLAAVRGARADVPAARFRAAQARRQDVAAARRAYGGRRHAPSHAPSYSWRRCAACLWVFPAREFQKDRRGSYWADCACCRAERRAA